MNQIKHLHTVLLYKGELKNMLVKANKVRFILINLTL